MKDVATKHQLRIARSTLKMADWAATILGGMTKEEAARVLLEKGSAADKKMVKRLARKQA